MHEDHVRREEKNLLQSEKPRALPEYDQLILYGSKTQDHDEVWTQCADLLFPLNLLILPSETFKNKDYWVVCFLQQILRINCRLRYQNSTGGWYISAFSWQVWTGQDWDQFLDMIGCLPSTNQRLRYSIHFFEIPAHSVGHLSQTSAKTALTASWKMLLYLSLSIADLLYSWNIKFTCNR